jgi:hypothetical protein
VSDEICVITLGSTPDSAMTINSPVVAYDRWSWRAVIHGEPRNDTELDDSEAGREQFQRMHSRLASVLLAVTLAYAEERPQPYEVESTLWTCP